MFAPCKDCPDRYVGCYGKCEKYRAFRASVDELAAKKRALRKYENDYLNVIHPSHIGMKTRW